MQYDFLKSRSTEIIYIVILTDYEIGQILKSSNLSKKYNVEIDRESAYEILQGKIANQNQAEREEQDYGKLRRAENYERQAPSRRTREEESGFGKIIKSPVTRSIAAEITRGLLGVLGLRSRRR